MTPAKLHALVDVDDYAHEQSNSGGKRRSSTALSQNPAADLSALASM